MQRKLLAWFTSGVLMVPLSTNTVFADVGDIPGGNGLYQYGHGMMGGGGQWGGFGMVLGPIFMILVLAGIIAAVIYVMRQMGSGNGTGQTHDRAYVLLKERYARGEIDSKEFDERKKLLND